MVRRKPEEGLLATVAAEARARPPCLRLRGGTGSQAVRELVDRDDGYRGVRRSELRRESGSGGLEAGGLPGALPDSELSVTAAASHPEIFDAIVVGSGAGGGPLTRELPRAGARVLVLEKGPALRREELVHDEIKFCRSNFLQPSVAEEPHVLVLPPGGAQITSEGWIASCVGGGTVHMSGFFLRLKP